MPLARIVEPAREGIRLAAEVLRNGGLVAFPTETVYGLGASALNERAVDDIFRAKGRPRTDPLIVHVYDPSIDLQYIRDSSENKTLLTHFDTLARNFWPGPLTIVVPSWNLPDAISAGTGFVGFRMPNHPVALALLRETKLPIAAPSANRFGHISPTLAEHVLSDLGDSEVLILNTDQPCQIGLESTVIGLSNDSIKIYRPGAVTREMLASKISIPILYEPNLSGQAAKPSSSSSSPKSSSSASVMGPQVSPGQLLSHYAPAQPAFIVTRGKPSGEVGPSCAPRHWAMVDCGGQWAAERALFAWYRDLSPKLDASEAGQRFFGLLREAESDSRVRSVVLAALPNKGGLWDALGDRMYRATASRSFRWGPPAV